MSDVIAQIGLAVTGVTAIILVSVKNKWGFVFGLAAQPFWFYTSYVNHQWGVFLVTIIYTFTWIWGIYAWFYRDNPAKVKKQTKV